MRKLLEDAKESHLRGYCIGNVRSLVILCFGALGPSAHVVVVVCVIIFAQNVAFIEILTCCIFSFALRISFCIQMFMLF